MDSLADGKTRYRHAGQAVLRFTKNNFQGARGGSVPDTRTRTESSSFPETR